MAKLLAACLALAALSLLLPSQPSYDPFAWLVWGREIAHGQLDTTGGSSWKPLPVVFTILFAPFSRLDDAIPVALWMVVARSGALLALAMAFRLAARLAGGGITGAIGGVVAALALLLLPDWLQFAGHGSEAPWAVALMLWAIERQLDGRRAHAFMLAALACLLRPELVPFLGVFAIWLWWAEPRLRLLLAGVAVVSAAAWLIPEWIGAGNPFDGAKQATGEPVWSLSHEERPWLAALERAHDQAGLLVELLLLATVAWALAARRVAPLVLAAVVAAEAALFAVMTQAGFSGNPRYVLPALTLACVLAGVGAARLLAVRPAAVGAAAGLALVVVAVPLAGERVERMERELHQVGVRMDLHHDLAEAVDRVGGPHAVTALGTATANRAYHSHLAWELKVPISAVEAVSAHRLVFRSWRVLSAGRVYTTGRARSRRTLLRVGDWRVVRRDRITFPLLQAQAHRRRPVYTKFAGN
jgi:hypothetical protein